jgi:exopolyphosphatase / guanosine-5'-triphosphate,3'-diphosphate pyrophosphatase
MTLITPRWERRAFGGPFAVAEEVFAGLEPSAVAESDELYLLTEQGDNVKVRDGMIDVKVLREVDHRRDLERWEPVLKAGFPIEAAAAVTVLEALRLPTTPLVGATYTLSELLEELIEPDAAVRVVSVHKRRIRYELEECMSELSEFEVDGRRISTLAVEATDPEAVRRAAVTLGLRERVNTSVPRGLITLIEGAPTRYAVIDVGTNSVKFHIGEQTGTGTMQAVVDRAEITRLGDGMAESGAIASAPLERTIHAIAGMVAEARRHRAQAIVAVGTAGLRTASNREAVVAAIETATGVAVSPISGDEESRLAYLAVRAELGLAEGSLVVFDTGGGSSQFTFGHGSEVDERFSVSVGAVRYTERHGLSEAVSAAQLEAALAAIASDLRRLDERLSPSALVGMGGAITNITAVMLGLDPYDPNAVQGATLDRTEIDRQIELYRGLDAEGRRSIVGLQPKRADVILAGACIVRTVMGKLGKQSMTVSDRGLRHGLFIDRFGANPDS